MDFLNNEGFTFNEKMNEWEKQTLDGMYTVYHMLDKDYIWILSYIDKDDYVHLIKKGSQLEIINSFKVLYRDTKIDEILGII